MQQETRQARRVRELNQGGLRQLEREWANNGYPWPHASGVLPPNLCLGGVGPEKPLDGYFFFGRGDTWPEELGHGPTGGVWNEKSTGEVTEFMRRTNLPPTLRLRPDISNLLVGVIQGLQESGRKAPRSFHHLQSRCLRIGGQKAFCHGVKVVWLAAAEVFGYTHCTKQSCVNCWDPQVKAIRTDKREPTELTTREEEWKVETLARELAFAHGLQDEEENEQDSDSDC